MIDIDKPRPLSHWIVGTFTFHFSEGAVVTRRVHLDEAKRVEAILSERRASDAIDWHALAWLQFDSERVVFSSFTVAEDGGWSMDPDDRDAIAKAGHPHGILRSLVDYWAERHDPEPAYSACALYLLHQAAIDGIDRKQWNDLARLFQGKDGARRIADASSGLQKPAPKPPRADDLAEPEPAPATDATGGQDDAETEDSVESEEATSHDGDAPPPEGDEEA